VELYYPLFKRPINPIVLQQNVKKRKMKSLVGVFFMVFVFLLEVMCCEGCWKQERESLISLNSQLGNLLSWLDNPNTDCCQWYGVECNTTTGRVAKLKLRSHTDEPWHLNYSSFLIFEDLKTLDMSSIRISNCIRTDQGYFSYKLYISDH